MENTMWNGFGYLPTHSGSSMCAIFFQLRGSGSLESKTEQLFSRRLFIMQRKRPSGEKTVLSSLEYLNSGLPRSSMSNFQEPSLANAKPNQLTAAKSARTFDDTRMSWPQQLQIRGKDSHLHPPVALSILNRVNSIECWCIASRLRFSRAHRSASKRTFF